MVALGPRVGGAHVGVNLKFNNRSVDLVGGQIHRQLARIGDRNRQVYQTIGRDAVAVWRAALGSIVTGAPLIGSAISGVAGAATMLAGALKSSIQSSYGLFTLLGSVAIAAGTARIGFEGFGDAINASDPEALAAALANLSPAAQESALAVRSLRDDWKRLRMTVQENMFAGLSGEISELSTTLLPVLERGLGKMADSLNGLFRSLLQYVNSDEGLKQINDALEGSADIFKRLSRAAVPFLDGLLRLYNALIPAGQRLADRIADIGERFQSWTQGEGFATRINDMMLRAEKTAGLLFKVLGNLGAGIANVFNAGGEETNNFLQMLVDVTQQFKDWSASAEGENSIVTWLQGSIEVMRAFGRAISSVFKVLTELADPRVIVSFLDTVGGAFDILGKLPLAAMVSAFATIAETLQPISSVLLAVVIGGAAFNIMIGTIVGQVAGLFSMFGRFSGIGDKVSKAFSGFGYAGKHVGQTTGAFRGLLGMIGRLAKFAGPVGLIVWAGTLIAKSDELKEKLGNVWDSFKDVFSALGEAFGEISSALGPVITALEPVFNVLDKIASLAIGVVLDAIAYAFQSIANVVRGLGRILGGLITFFHGLFTLDFTKMWEGIKKMASGIWPLLQGVFGLFISFFAPARLLKIGAGALKGLWGGMKGAMPGILSGIGTFLMNMLKFFVTLTPRLLAFGWNALKGLGSGIARAMPGILSSIGRFISSIFSWFGRLPGQLLGLGQRALAGFNGAVSAAIPRVLAAAGRLVSGVINWIARLPGRLMSLGQQALARLNGAVTAGIPRILAAAGRIVSGVINWIARLPGRLLSLGQQAISRLNGAVSAGVGRLRSTAGRIVSAVLGAIRSLPGQLFNIAKQIPAKIASGILGGIGKVKDAVGKIASAVRGFFPGSPVEEGPLTAWNRGGDATGAGYDLIRALSKGLQDTSSIKKAMDGVASEVARSFTPTIGAGALGGGAGVTNTRQMSITINNPAPETASDSLTRTTRNLAYLGLA